MKKIKVFHGLVNYGTQSGFFAKELRINGIEAISLTYYDPFDRQTDVVLRHGGSFFEKIKKRSWNRLFKLRCFFKYNIFHFYFGNSLFPYQLDLPLYKIFGKKVIMEYLGSDCQLYKYSLNKYKWTNMNRFSEEIGLLHDSKIKKRMLFEQRFIDLNLVCSPIYSEFVENAFYLPLGIDLNEYKFEPLPKIDSLIRIVHAPTSQLNKGSSFIIAALNRLVQEGYPIEIDLVENVTHDELKKRYILGHIFIDQILAGGIGTASIEAMALGRPVVAFIRSEFLIQYGSDLPVISADPDTIYDVIKDILDHKINDLSEIGISSRKYVENNNDIKILTKKLINLYKNL